MSSEFCTELKPDRRARGIVLTAGGVATLAGVAVILQLQVLTLITRLLLALAWLLLGAAELRYVRGAQRRLHGITLRHDGQVHIAAADGTRQAAELAAGCVVLRRIAWLRLRTATGRRHAELVHGDSRQSQQWRRLQVIWRHLGASP